MFLLFLLCAPVYAGKSQVVWKHYLEMHPELSPPTTIQGWFWNTYPTKQQVDAYEAEKDERNRLKLANDLEVDDEMTAMEDATRSFERERTRNEFYRKSREADVEYLQAKTSLESCEGLSKTAHAQTAIFEKLSSLLAESQTTLERQMNYSRDLNEHLASSLEDRMTFQMNMMMTMTVALFMVYLQNWSIRRHLIEYPKQELLGF
jgi:hypothetical protein